MNTIIFFALFTASLVSGGECRVVHTCAAWQTRPNISKPITAGCVEPGERVKCE